MSGVGVIADHESHPLFLPLVFVGGAVFGVGLAVSQMARPEIVLEFLQFRDFGLVFVMGGARARRCRRHVSGRSRGRAGARRSPGSGSGDDGSSRWTET